MVHSRARFTRRYSSARSARLRRIGTPLIEALEPRTLLSTYPVLADNFLDVGNCWQYDGLFTVSDSVRVSTPFVMDQSVIGAVTIDGQLTYDRQTHIQAGADDIYEDSYLSLTPTTLSLNKYASTSAGGTENCLVRNSDPLEMLPRSMNSGASNVTVGQGQFDGSAPLKNWTETDTSAASFQGVVNVKLQIGATTQTIAAIKVKDRVNKAYGDNSTGYTEDVYWINPDFGIVKGTHLEFEGGHVTMSYSYILHNYSLANPLPTRTLSINDVQVSEPVKGAAAAVFTVTLSRPALTPVTATFATADGTATAGLDYVAAAKSLTIPAGQLSGRISVTIRADALAEGEETFFVNLTSATNANIADSQGQGTIADPPIVSVGASDAVEGQQAGTFEIHREGGSSADLTVRFTLSGTATPGTAYTLSSDGSGLTSNSVVIPAGQQDVTISVTPADDSISEPFRTAILSLQPNAAYSIATPLSPEEVVSKATVNIQDNDPPSSFRIGLLFDNILTVQQEQLAQQTASRWEQVITGPLYRGSDWTCDKVVHVYARTIDGPGGTLGESYLGSGVVYMDLADIGRLSKHTFVSVIMHEIGHALGLDHTVRTDDVMYYRAGNTKVTTESANALVAMGFDVNWAFVSP